MLHRDEVFLPVIVHGRASSEDYDIEVLRELCTQRQSPRSVLAYGHSDGAQSFLQQLRERLRETDEWLAVAAIYALRSTHLIPKWQWIGVLRRCAPDNSMYVPYDQLDDSLRHQLKAIADHSAQHIDTLLQIWKDTIDECLLQPEVWDAVVEYLRNAPLPLVRHIVDRLLSTGSEQQLRLFPDAQWVTTPAAYDVDVFAVRSRQYMVVEQDDARLPIIMPYFAYRGLYLGRRGDRRHPIFVWHFQRRVIVATQQAPLLEIDAERGPRILTLEDARKKHRNVTADATKKGQHAWVRWLREHKEKSAAHWRHCYVARSRDQQVCTPTGEEIPIALHQTESYAAIWEHFWRQELCTDLPDSWASTSPYAEFLRQWWADAGGGRWVCEAEHRALTYEGAYVDAHSEGALQRALYLPADTLLTPGGYFDIETLLHDMGVWLWHTLAERDARLHWAVETLISGLQTWAMELQERDDLPGGQMNHLLPDGALLSPPQPMNAEALMRTLWSRFLWPSDILRHAVGHNLRRTAELVVRCLLRALPAEPKHLGSQAAELVSYHLLCAAYPEENFEEVYKRTQTRSQSLSWPRVLLLRNNFTPSAVVQWGDDIRRVGSPRAVLGIRRIAVALLLGDEGEGVGRAWNAAMSQSHTLSTADRHRRETAHMVVQAAALADQWVKYSVIPSVLALACEGSAAWRAIEVAMESIRRTLESEPVLAAMVNAAGEWRDGVRHAARDLMLCSAPTTA